MSVQLTDDGRIELRGDCPREDAEALLVYLSQAKRTVDWRACDSAHGAVVQVLAASHTEILGPPRGAFLRRFVEAALKAR